MEFRYPGLFRGGRNVGGYVVNWDAIDRKIDAEAQRHKPLDWHSDSVKPKNSDKNSR